MSSSPDNAPRPQHASTWKPDYRRLAQYLAARTERTATLTFSDIERIVGGALPLDAYERRQWWESKSSYAGHWRNAGWRIETVDILGRLITFARNAP